MLKHLKSLSGHQNPVYALANSAKPGLFFTAGNDKGIVEWSLEKMSFLKVLMPVKTSVYSLHGYHDRLYAGLRSGEISVFDFQQQQVLATFQAHEKPVFDLLTIPEKEELISASEDGTVAVWSLTDLSLLYRIPVAQDTVRVMAVSKTSPHIAFGCKDGLIRLYNLSDYSLITTLEKHTLPVTSLQFSADGKYLISGGRDAQLNIWSLPDYALRESITAHMFSIYAIAFHPTLPYFATASQDKSIKLWGSENLKLYKVLSIDKNTHGHTHSVNKLVWSADGKQLISTGDDKMVIIWEWE